MAVAMLALIFIAAAADPALTVSAADRAAEVARLQALGLKVIEVALERPWDEPFTSRSLVTPAAWFSKAGATVKASALAADLPILQRIMSRAYGGWETAEKRGWNWAAWFNDWQKALVARHDDVLPLAEAFAPMKTLITFQLDNHTNIPLSRDTFFGSGSEQVLLPLATEPCTALENEKGESFALDAKDPAQRARAALAWEGSRLSPASYVSVPANRGAIKSVTCGKSLSVSSQWPPAVKPFAASPEREAPILAIAGKDEPDLKVIKDVAYLRLPTFSKENSQRIAERAPKWPKPSDKIKALVVDLRDNEGGDAAIEVLAPWVGEARLKAALDKAMNGHRHQGASCLYNALRWGYTLVTSRQLKAPLDPELLADLQSSVDALAAPAPADCPRAFKDTNSNWGYRDHHFSEKRGPERPILLLINNGCGSDCEFMTEVLAALPETIVAGQNSYGVGQYIQPGYAVLPHTRLPFRIALGTSDNYGDDRSFDGYGFDVDIVLPSEAANSAASILALAERLASRSR